MNANPLRGKILFKELKKISKNNKLCYTVTKNKVDDKYKEDFITSQELKKFNPDLIFFEGGILNSDDFKIDLNLLESLVNGGSTIFICDLDWNTINQYYDIYKDLFNMAGITIAFNNNEPVELFDSKSFYNGESQIICIPKDISYEPWLHTVYEDLPNFVVGNPVPLKSWVELVGTCNRSSTKTTSFYNEVFNGEFHSGPFAAMKKIGLGYIVVILGNVTNDVYTREFPSNVTWLTKLAITITERVQIDKRRNSVVYKLFISHRHFNKEFAIELRNELRERGIGSWLDNNELIFGDELTPTILSEIDNCSHFILVWSEHCVNIEWILLEYSEAISKGKRLFIVRLDDTPIPPILQDRLRIEAHVMRGKEVAKNIIYHIEREEMKRRKK